MATPPSEVYDAYYAKNLVYIPRSERLIELRDRGFGTLSGQRLLLSTFESFYLNEKGRIRVFDAGGKNELSLRDLVKKISGNNPEVWIKYLIYRDLRDRGYIVRESEKADFEIHGKGPVRRLISIVYEGRETKLVDLERLLSRAEAAKKELILAVIDRRTDIVYYSLGSMSFRDRNAVRKIGE